MRILAKRSVGIGCMLGIGVLLCLLAVSEEQLLPTISNQTKVKQTLVLDAGHGGMDGGAVAADGTTEQDINLSIVWSCHDLATFLGQKTVMTRTDGQSLDYQADNSIRQNKVADIHARERITKEQNNPIFISVHLNKFSDASYSGAQSFWSQNNQDGQRLAEEIQTALTTGLHPERERSAKPAENSIYLMKHLTCPAVIVECGFLSNEQDVQKLKDKTYQKKLAVCIISGYHNAMEE